MLRAVLRPAVTGMVPDWPPLSPTDRDTVRADAVEHVVAVVGGAPLHFRIGIFGLAVGFALAAALLGFGRGYGRRDLAWRIRFDALWNRCRGPMRSYERLVHSLTVLASLEHPISRRAMGLETDMARQDRMRRLRSVNIPETAP